MSLETQQQRITRAAHAGACAFARQERLDRMWQRYCAICAKRGETPIRARTSAGRCRILSYRVMDLPGWWFADALEVADLGCDNEGVFRPTPIDRATPARQGTRNKIEVLAARVMAGESLWHDEDGGDDDD